jgi:N-acetylglutamate synthase-like GNAT family acetyltransferase
MKMILRQAVKKDLPAILNILKPWTEREPTVSAILENLPSVGEKSHIQCRVFEQDKTIRCVGLWVQEQKDLVRLLALGFGPGASDVGADSRFIREAILDWSDMRIAKVIARIPEALAPALMGPLKSSGFMFEGISSSLNQKEQPQIHLCKHFLYHTLPHSQTMSFLRGFLVSLGYEVRQEGDEGFGFRIRSEYRLPFIFSAWHRVTRSGSDIIVHPPARVLELHELETLFYPLQIHSRSEKPLLLPMEKKRATPLIELPHQDNHQDTLFDPGAMRHKTLPLNNLTYSYPTGLQGMRKGLPLLFYVNRLGAVGSGRVEEWSLDEPKNLYTTIDEMGFFDPEDVKEHAATSGPRAGKVLVIRFHWYKSFRRPVGFDEIRRMDENFNPQRTRTLSWDLFHSVMAAGG